MRGNCGGQAMTKSTVTQAPYSTAGNLMHHLHDVLQTFGEWRPNDPIVMTLQLESTKRGQSAAYFIWKDLETGSKWPMFISSLRDLLLAADVLRGQVTGVWNVTKNGQNYGIRLLSLWPPEGASLASEPQAGT